MDRLQVIKEEEKKKTKRRAGTPKSKLGCMTCRVRRIKCDENKPTCNRCSSTGRICDYEKTSTAPPRRVMVANTQTQLQAPIILQPKSFGSAGGSPSNLEDDHLEYFEHLTRKGFSGFNQYPLWDLLNPHLAAPESPLRFAAIALSILFRHQTNLGSKVSRADKAFASSMYQTAVQCLKHDLEAEPSGRTVDMALNTIILLALFESTAGDHSSAMTHIHGGNQILRAHGSKIQPPQRREALIRTFNHFQNKTDEHLATYQKPLSVNPFHTSAEGLLDARDNLNAITSHLQAFYSTTSERHRTLPDIALCPNIQFMLTQARNRLQLWQRRYRHLSASPAPDAAFEAARLILEVRHLHATIELETRFYRDELATDAYMAPFTTLVDLASAAYDAQGRQAGDPVFTLEEGLIPALFFVATKCRRPVTRRRAVSLLERAGFEGVLDGNAYAAAAKWVVQKEEEDGVEDEFVPEEKRLRQIGFLTDRVARVIKIASARRPADDGDLEYVACHVGWGVGFNESTAFVDPEGTQMWKEEWQAYAERYSARREPGGNFQTLSESPTGRFLCRKRFESPSM